MALVAIVDKTRYPFTSQDLSDAIDFLVAVQTVLGESEGQQKVSDDLAIATATNMILRFTSARGANAVITPLDY